MNNKPTIVVLCGSTRFSQAFQDANLSETLAGRIVLSIGINTKSDDDLIKAGIALDKEALDQLHLRKIDLADEVLILNVGGYVGASTTNEIRYAIWHSKPLRWLEPDKIPAWVYAMETNEIHPLSEEEKATLIQMFQVFLSLPNAKDLQLLFYADTGGHLIETDEATGKGVPSLDWEDVYDGINQLRIYEGEQQEKAKGSDN